MLELVNGRLSFGFPEIGARLDVELVKTIRIPDDGKKYNLPPGLGMFPIEHVDDYKDKVPGSWVKHGGVIIPMYQSEAMWLKFNSYMLPGYTLKYPFAVRIATGKVNCVTGKKWTKSPKEGNYMVAPTQPWIDGYVVSDGVVKQFVAAPLGQGYTAEEQLTGKAEFGGLQIEVSPMKLASYTRLSGVVQRSQGFLRSNPIVDDSHLYGSLTSYNANIGSTASVLRTRSFSSNTLCTTEISEGMSKLASMDPGPSEMGIAPGGSMLQQVYKDPYEFSDWDFASSSRCFIHMLNSEMWTRVTGKPSPTKPLNASIYARLNYPWFDYYEDRPSMSGTKETSKLKSIEQINKEKNNVVRDGVWK